MIFIDYDAVPVPQTNSNGAILHTTSYKCMVYFEPDGTGMESDSPVGIYILGYYNDTDGDDFNPFLFYAHDDFIGSSSADVVAGYRANADDLNKAYLTSMIVPSGKEIRAFISNSSDRLKGTLHIFRLPEAE